MNSRQTCYINDIIEANEGLKAIAGNIREGFCMLRQCFENGGKALICGNGGSASDAEHITGELMKGFMIKRPITKSNAKMIELKFPGEAEELAARLQRGLPAISLVSQTSLITAIANDVSADMIFAQQAYVYGMPGDVLIAISTSGNAENVINAAKVAVSMDVKVLALTGGKGGALGKCCDIMINVPLKEIHLIQEAHIKIYHAICADLENHFYGGVNV